MRSPEEVAAEVFSGMGYAVDLDGVPTKPLADLVRARDAELSEQVRAETLAGFTEEWAVLFGSGPAPLRDEMQARRIAGQGTDRSPARRLVGPWTKIEP